MSVRQKRGPEYGEAMDVLWLTQPVEARVVRDYVTSINYEAARYRRRAAVLRDRLLEMGERVDD